MSERLDRIERILDNLATNQINERESRLALREDLEILYQTVRQSAETTDRAISQLTTAIEHLAENSQEDRAEIRRIWEYLMAQGKNGHGRLD